MSADRSCIAAGVSMCAGCIAVLIASWPAAARAEGSAKSTAATQSAAKPTADGRLHIIAFGAHPDDCEIEAGGVATLWAAQGHHVKFVSMTNGDIGHWRMAGGPLARRRMAEVERAAKIFGIQTEVLDIHDGELMPTLENRRIVTRLIRRWKADVVLTCRPNDYHPDHRYTGILVQDAAYMVTVPFFCPDVPHLKANPVFFYWRDTFQKPNPFHADVVVAVDDVLKQKLDALAGIESQFLEGGVSGHKDLVPADPAGRQARIQQVRDYFAAQFEDVAKKYRAELIAIYGQERGNAVRAVEAFELCEYGDQPSADRLRELFPFIPQKK